MKGKKSYSWLAGHSRFAVLSILLASILLYGCAANRPTDLLDPVFSIINIQLLHSSGLNPEFELTLRVANPNRVPLDIIGMSYDLMLDGHKVVSGVASDFPVIDAYSEQDVRVSARLNLVGSINLIRELASRNNNRVLYELIARVDVGENYPVIIIGELDEIDL